MFKWIVLSSALVAICYAGDAYTNPAIPGTAGYVYNPPQGLNFNYDDKKNYVPSLTSPPYGQNGYWNQGYNTPYNAGYNSRWYPQSGYGYRNYAGGWYNRPYPNVQQHP